MRDSAATVVEPLPAVSEPLPLRSSQRVARGTPAPTNRTEAHGEIPASPNATVAPRLRADGFTLEIGVPPELVAAIAAQAAELVEASVQPEPYMTAEQAAQYLACKVERIHALVSADRIPHHRDGSRLLFRRSELDDWISEGGGIRP